MPTLGVFMPNYNHAQFLPRAIEAIASQSRQPDEFLIIDDGSSDESVSIIKGYQKKYPFIRLIAYDKNRGLMHIMQTILTEITTDYVFGSAADDYVLPGFFEAVLLAAEVHPEAGILFAPMAIEDESGVRLPTSVPAGLHQNGFLAPAEYLTSFLFVEAPMNSYSASTVYRTAALSAVGGFRPELGPWCDTFAIRAAALRFGAYYLVQPAAVWTKQTNSVSHAARKNPTKMFRYVRKAVQLMRSPEFATYFPASYVQSWQLGYALSLYGGFLLSLLPLPEYARQRVVRFAVQGIRTRIRLL